MYFVIYNIHKSKIFGKNSIRAKGRDMEVHHYSRFRPYTMHKVV